MTLPSTGKCLRRPSGVDVGSRAERVELIRSSLNDSHLFRHSVGTSNAFERNEQFSVDNNCFNLTHYPQEDQSVPLSPTSKLLKRFKQTEN